MPSAVARSETLGGADDLPGAGEPLMATRLQPADFCPADLCLSPADFCRARARTLMKFASPDVVGRQRSIESLPLGVGIM
jgi:hypothetical protein